MGRGHIFWQLYLKEDGRRGVPPRFKAAGNRFYYRLRKNCHARYMLFFTAAGGTVPDLEINRFLRI